MNKTRKRLMSVTLSFLIGIIISVGTVTVFAGSAQSPNGYITVYGHDYFNYSYIFTGLDYANATSRLQTQDYSNVPAGYMGAMARLFDSNNNLIVQTSWEYNTTSTNALNSSWASKLSAPTGYYYSYGNTSAYNGNGYTTFYTYKSPNQKVG